MSKPIRKRSEVAAEFTWDLTDIFPSDEAWRAEYEALKPYAEAVAAYQGRLGESAETLLAYFRLDDELNVRVGRIELPVERAVDYLATHEEELWVDFKPFFGSLQLYCADWIATHQSAKGK